MLTEIWKNELAFANSAETNITCWFLLVNVLYKINGKEEWLLCIRTHFMIILMMISGSQMQ
jgi:hypothetical protein